MAGRTAGGAVAAPRQEAVEIGRAVLAEGGNALDAAIAAVFALGVAEPYMGGIGGVGEIVFCGEDGRVHVVDCAARAPRRAAAELYEVVGDATGLYGWPQVAGDRNIRGPLAVAAPRLVGGLSQAHARFGRLPWADLVRPAAALARAGVIVDHMTAAVLAHEMRTLTQDPLARALYYPDGVPLPPPLDGNPAVVRNEALAAALDLIAERGAAPFEPGGEIAAAILASFRDGAVLEAGDFEPLDDAVLDDVAPLAGFRGWRVFGSPRPSGAVTAAQILGLLDHLDVVGTADSPARYAALAAASARAFGDRYRLLSGDGAEAAARILSGPALRQAAAGLVEDAAAAPARAAAVAHPPPATATTHVAVADGGGAVASITQTLLSLYGAQVGVPAFGFFLNNGMMWFDPRPGNAASIRPGARALAAVSPVVALGPDGRRRIAAGALGARRIITAVAQVVQNIVDFGDTAAAADDRPRVHADGIGPALVDHRLPAAVREALAERHDRVETAYYGPTTLNFARAFAVAADAATGTAEAGLDARSRSVWAMNGEG